jgi:hypothetical protein
MSSSGLLLTLRYVTLTFLVLLMAALSSGAVLPGLWPGMGGIGMADARGLPTLTQDRGRIMAEADNGPACDPRPNPRLQTVRDASNALQVTITAATASGGQVAILREIRIGPLQNAAVDIGPYVARTSPLAYTVPGGSAQLTLRVTRVVASQPSQIVLVLVDDCGEWRTFVGGGTGIAVAAPLATATPVPIVPGQPYGSIPITLAITGSDTGQYPPGSRPRVQISTRAGATCTLTTTWPDGQTQAAPALTANAQGACLFRPTVPIGMRSGTATVAGVVQDIFGLNIRQATFTVGGTLTPGDNIASVDPFEDDDNLDNAE